MGKKPKTKDRTKLGHGTNSASPPVTSPSFPPHLLTSINRKKPHDNASVVPLCPGSVFVSRNFLSQSECNAWVQHAESNIGFEPVSHPATRYVAHRECFRIQKTDWSVADWLFQRMKHVIDTVSKQITITHRDDTYRPVGCNGNIRIYKYEKGMSFGRHYDESNEISRYEHGNTELTVLVYLSSCVGGATRFFPEGDPSAGKKSKKSKVAGGRGSSQKSGDNDGSLSFVPEAGAVLLHVHGDRCLLHEADEVEDGVKYILRTDVVYGTSAA